MKKFLLGFGLGIFSFLLAGDLIRVAADDAKPESKLQKARFAVMDPGLGLWLPLSERCTKDIRQSPGGTETVMREYFQCNKFQNKLSDLIYKR